MSNERPGKTAAKPQATRKAADAAAIQQPARNPEHTPMQPQQRRYAPNARHHLTTKVFEALCADFDAHGADAICACREEQPQGYLRLVVSLLSKEPDPDENRLKDIPDGELDSLVEFFRGRLFGRNLSEARGEGKIPTPP